MQQETSCGTAPVLPNERQPMTSRSKQDHLVVAIHVTDRVQQAGMVQSILTKYGRSIKTRIGLHEPAARGPSPNGIILLELVGTKAIAKSVIADLRKVDGVEAKSIVFAH